MRLWPVALARSWRDGCGCAPKTIRRWPSDPQPPPSITESDPFPNLTDSTGANSEAAGLREVEVVTDDEGICPGCSAWLLRSLLDLLCRICSAEEPWDEGAF
jgi:hypothetical protein